MCQSAPIQLKPPTYCLRRHGQPRRMTLVRSTRGPRAQPTVCNITQRRGFGAHLSAPTALLPGRMTASIPSNMQAGSCSHLIERAHRAIIIACEVEATKRVPAYHHVPLVYTSGQRWKDQVSKPGLTEYAVR